MKSYKEFISINQSVRSGQACIGDTRITVVDILSYLASGMTNEDIIIDFPELNIDDILAALAFAAESQKSTSALNPALY